MSYRDTVVATALQELSLPVHWKTGERRILEYFRTSTGTSFTKHQALQVSWCSYFVHWVLAAAGMQTLPMVGTAGSLGKLGSVGRFMKINGAGGVYDSYPVTDKKYQPKPGDMYHRPTPNNHIGFISDVREAGNGSYEIRSIDGNSGPLANSPYFDMSETTVTNHPIGYGFIYQPSGWRKLADECWYIQLCDED